jgi:hypothetical protein
MMTDTSATVFNFPVPTPTVRPYQLVATSELRYAWRRSCDVPWYLSWMKSHEKVLQRKYLECHDSDAEPNAVWIDIPTVEEEPSIMLTALGYQREC